jgi:hypothetical protein
MLSKEQGGQLGLAGLEDAPKGHGLHVDPEHEPVPAAARKLSRLAPRTIAAKERRYTGGKDNPSPAVPIRGLERDDPRPGDYTKPAPPAAESRNN